MNVGFARNCNMTIVKLINKAGTVVEPNADTTLSAMNDFRDEVHQGTAVWMMRIRSMLLLN